MFFRFMDYLFNVNLISDINLFVEGDTFSREIWKEALIR